LNLPLGRPLDTAQAGELVEEVVGGSISDLDLLDLLSYRLEHLSVSRQQASRNVSGQVAGTALEARPDPAAFLLLLAQKNRIAAGELGKPTTDLGGLAARAIADLERLSPGSVQVDNTPTPVRARRSKAPALAKVLGDAFGCGEKRLFLEVLVGLTVAHAGLLSKR